MQTYLARPSSIALALCIAGAPSIAPAQTVPTQSGEASPTTDIVVTAERRATTLSKTPIAISAFSGADLKQNNILSTVDLQRTVPSMQIGSFGPLTRITLRGVGMENFAGGNIGGDSGVSFAVDGVLYTRPQMFTAGFFDVARIEVLRGPQGTLYGRNAIGGSVNIVTNGPTDTLEGYANLTLGSRDLVRGEAAVGGPIVGDVIEGRVAFRANRIDGDLKNITTGNDLGALNEREGRATVDILPGRAFNVRLSGDYYQNRSNGIADEQLPSAIGGPLAGQTLGGTYIATDRTVSVNNDGFNRSRIWGVSAKVNGDLGFADTSLIASYRHMWADDGGDLDGTTALYADSLGRVNQSHNETIEWTISSKPAAKLQWVAGLLYLHETGDGSQHFRLYTYGSDFFSGGHVITNSYAAYAQATYPILDAVKFTAGFRYSIDKKSETEYVDFMGRTDQAGTKTWHAPTPRFTLDWTVNPTIIAYATIARGYKSGGFNLGALQGGPYNPEYVWDYEAGLKGRFFGDHLQVSVAGYHYDYSNMQEERILGLVAALENASKSSINGFEMQGNLSLSRAFSIDATYGYTSAKFGKFLTQEDEHPEPGTQDLDGNRVPNVPRNTFDIGTTYKVFNVIGTGTVTVRADVAYRSKTFFSPFNRDYTSQSAYALVNARLGYATGPKGFSLAAFVTNLTDKRAQLGSVVNSALLSYSRDTQLIRGRVVGVEAGYSF